MKIKKYLFVLLSVTLFACGNDIDMQPDLVSPAGTTPPSPPPSGFTVISNMAALGDDGKKAEVSFGLNQTLSEDITLVVEISARIGDTGPYSNLLHSYGTWTIQAGTSLSEFKTIDVEELYLCASSANVKAEVVEVRYDGVLVPAENYSLLGVNSDGSAELEMNGTGSCASPAGPGYVSGPKFLGKQSTYAFYDPSFTPVWGANGCYGCYSGSWGQ